MVVAGGVIPAQDYQFYLMPVLVAVFGPGTKLVRLLLKF
jgi:methylmalonyl-CoA mutase cobalamin-binding domain/chain